MNKHIKRLCLILTVLLTAGLFCSGTLADATQKVTLPEIGLSLNVPGDYYVLTRNMPSNDPTLQRIGISNEYVTNYLENQDLFLLVMNALDNVEITVSATDAIMEEFRGTGDMLLNIVASFQQGVYEELGIFISKQAVFRHPQTPFVMLEGKATPSSGTTVEIVSYMTVVGEQTVNINLRCINCSAAPYKTMFEQVIDSVNFAGVPVLGNSAGTVVKEYRDPVAGITYTLNDKWTKGKEIKKNVGIWTQFDRQNADGTGILIGVADMMDPSNGEVPKSMKREDLNNDYFTESDIKEMISAAGIGTVGKGGLVTVNNNSYYKYPVTVEQDLQGLMFSVDVLCYFRIWNGYMINIYFYGDENDQCYMEFRNMLRSIQYPNIDAKMIAAAKAAVASGSAKTAAKSASPSAGSLFGAIVLGLLLTVAVHLGPILILRYAILKHPVSKKKGILIVVVDTLIVTAIMVMISIFNDGSGYSMPAIALWTFICFKILTNGYAEYQAAQQTAAAAPDVVQTPVYAEEMPPVVTVLSQSEKTTETAPVEEPEEAPAPLADTPTDMPAAPAEAPTAPIEAPTAPVQTATAYKFCIYCGTPLNPNGLFCPNCGQRIDGK